MTFLSRLVETYGDLLSNLIEYRFEFCQRTWMGFQKLQNYTTNIFISAYKINQSDANYIVSMFEDQTKDWNSLNTKLIIEETQHITKGEKCTQCDWSLNKTQFVWLECPDTQFWKECIEKNMANFKKYHSNYFCREICHGQHVVVEVKILSNFTI